MSGMNFRFRIATHVVSETLLRKLFCARRRIGGASMSGPAQASQRSAASRAQPSSACPSRPASLARPANPGQPAQPTPAQPRQPATPGGICRGVCGGGKCWKQAEPSNRPCVPGPPKTRRIPRKDPPGARKTCGFPHGQRSGFKLYPVWHCEALCGDAS